MNCKSLVYRDCKRKNYKKKPYCKANKVWLPICTRECDKLVPKEYKQLKKSDKPIKQYSNKRAKAEKERYSIFTSDLKHCIECKENGIERTGVNLHEIFYGTGKRQLSIKYGTVIPLCNSLHHNQVESKGIHFDRILCDKWYKKGQLKYMEYYKKTEEEFREVFGRSYL